MLPRDLFWLGQIDKNGSQQIFSTTISSSGKLERARVTKETQVEPDFAHCTIHLANCTLHLASYSSHLATSTNTLQVVVHNLQIELACCNLYFVLYIFHRARATTEKQVESKSAPLLSQEY